MVFNMERDLLLEAIETPYAQWMTIQKLIDLTDDEEVKERLRRVMIEKHHSEEYYTGNL